MKLRIDTTLRFWIDVAYENIKSKYPRCTKPRLLASILRQYEQRGDAMRFVNRHAKVCWKATPSFLEKLADVERDAQDDLADIP